MSRSGLLNGRSKQCHFCDLFLKIIDEFFPGLGPAENVMICRADRHRSFRIICQNSNFHEDARTLDVYAPDGRYFRSFNVQRSDIG
jgi:hypothetical protein